MSIRLARPAAERTGWGMAHRIGACCDRLPTAGLIERLCQATQLISRSFQLSCCDREGTTMAAGRTSRARGAHMFTVSIVDAKACVHRLHELNRGPAGQPNAVC